MVMYRCICFQLSNFVDGWLKKNPTLHRYNSLKVCSVNEKNDSLDVLYTYVCMYVCISFNSLGRENDIWKKKIIKHDNVQNNKNQS